MIDYIKNKVQLYSENTAIKYPLDDTITDTVPYDILVDLSLSMKFSELPAYVTNIACNGSSVFVSIENSTVPIAYAAVTSPAPFHIYQLNTLTDYAYGWIVFGPGVRSQFNIRNVRMPVDRRCIVPAKEASSKFNLSVNGFVYDMPDILKIKSNFYVSQTVENRAVGSNPSRQCLTLRRDDTKLTEATLKTGLTDIDPDSIPLGTVNGIKPDSAGNINLTITTEDGAENVTLTKIDDHDLTNLGQYISTSGMDECEDPDLQLLKDIKKSDEGHGVPYELPLDCIFDDTCPETY